MIALVARVYRTDFMRLERRADGVIFCYRLGKTAAKQPLRFRNGQQSLEDDGRGN